MDKVKIMMKIIHMEYLGMSFGLLQNIVRIFNNGTLRSQVKIRTVRLVKKVGYFGPQTMNVVR